MKLKTLLEGALIGAAKEIEGSKRALTWSGLAEIVARYPEISEGYSLYLKAKAQREAVEAERDSDVRTVSNGLSYQAADGAYRSANPKAGFKYVGDGGTEV